MAEVLTPPIPRLKFPAAKAVEPATPIPDVVEESMAGVEPSIPTPQPKKTKVVDWDWSPLTNLAAVATGAIGGALSPVKLKEAYTAAQDRSGAQLPFEESVFTNVVDMISGPAQAAAHILLPSLTTAEVDPVTGKVKNVDEEQHLKKAWQLGEHLGAGAIGGTVGLAKSLGDDPVETFMAQPAVMTAVGLPLLKGATRTIKSVRATSKLPEVAASVEPTGRTSLLGEGSIPTILRQAVDNASSLVPDRYMRLVVDGFHTGNKAATALVEEMARAPERAAEAINLAAEQFGASAKRAKDAPKIPTRSGKTAADIVVPVAEAMEAADEMGTPVSPSTTIDPATLNLRPTPSAEVRDAALAQRAIEKSQEALSAAQAPPSLRSRVPISPEGKLLPELAETRPVHSVREMLPLGAVRSILEGQTLGGNTRKLVDGVKQQLADLTGADPLEIQQRVEHALGQSIMGSWQAQLAADPKPVWKKARALIEQDIGRPLTAPEQVSILGTLKRPAIATTEAGAAARLPTVEIAGKVIDPVKLLTARTLEDVSTIGVSELAKATKELVANQLADLQRGTLRRQLDKEAARVSAPSDQALVATIQQNIDRVIAAGNPALQKSLTGVSVSADVAPFVAGLLEDIQKGDLPQQVMKHPPAMVAAALRATSNDPAVQAAASKIGSYRPIKGIDGAPLYAPELVATAVEAHNAAQSSAKNPISQHLKGAVTASNLASGANNILGNSSFGSIRRGVPATVLFAKGLKAVSDLDSWTKGRTINPATAEAFEALRGTNALSSDFLSELKTASAEAGQGRTQAAVRKVISAVDALNTPLHYFYKMGDAPFRLEESLAQYKQWKKYTNMLEEGATLTLDQGRRQPILRKTASGYELADPLAPRAQDRGYRAITPEQLQKELGKVAANRGAELTFDYGDTNQMAKWIRSVPDMGVLSSFVSWGSHALDLPGKKGLWAKSFGGSPFNVETTSPSILRDNALSNISLGVRRAMMASAARNALLSGQNDELKPAYEKADSKDRRILAHALSVPGATAGVDLGAWAAGGPTNTLVKLLAQARSLALPGLAETSKDTQGVTGYGPMLGDVQPAVADLNDKDRKLLELAATNKLGTMKDALSLVHVGGTLLSSLWDKVQDADSIRNAFGVEDLAETALPLLTGVTTAKALRWGLTGSGGKEPSKFDDLRVPVGKAVVDDILGKAWKAKDVSEASPADTRSFLNAAKTLLLRAANVEPKSKLDARIAEAEYNLRDAKRVGDASAISTRQEELRKLETDLERQAALREIIEDSVSDAFDTYDSVLNALQGKVITTPKSRALLLK